MTPNRRRRLWLGLVETGWFLVVVGLWTFGLALLFLAIAWPRWAFYAVLVIGVVVFASLHSGRSRRRSNRIENRPGR